MIHTLAVENYRSLRDLKIELCRLNVVTGPNGSGKSSLYRALRLLADAAQGNLVASLAREGGLASTLWAGPESISPGMRAGRDPVEGTRRKKPVSLRLGFGGEHLGYSIELGLPAGPGKDSAFVRDPEIKREAIWAGPVFSRRGLMVNRQRMLVNVADERGALTSVSSSLEPWNSVLTEVADPERAPVVYVVRDMVRSWRFYDHFRSDVDAPVRRPQVGTLTPVLGHDGHDLAAALQTIREVGDARALHAAIDDAFPGTSVDVDVDHGRFLVTVAQPGMLRPLEASELSDGTLRYLMWVAALHTPRPPELMVLNEPETSLHPDLLPPLGRLIARAAEQAQVWVITHSERLVAALAEAGDACMLHLHKDFGETVVAGQRMLDKPRWTWPPR